MVEMVLPDSFERVFDASPLSPFGPQKLHRKLSPLPLCLCFRFSSSILPALCRHLFCWFGFFPFDAGDYMRQSEDVYLPPLCIFQLAQSLPALKTLTYVVLVTNKRSTLTKLDRTPLATAAALLPV